MYPEIRMSMNLLAFCLSEKKKEVARSMQWFQRATS
jgi:hypothetical protein